MADNFLEKQYAKQFGDSSAVDPETGYSVQSKARGYRKTGSSKKLPIFATLNTKTEKKDE